MRNYIQFVAPRKVKPSPFGELLTQSVKRRWRHYPSGFCLDAYIDRSNRDKKYIYHY
jgi:hypothetical protein